MVVVLSRQSLGSWYLSMPIVCLAWAVMLDIVNYSQHSNVLFDVGVADCTVQKIVSKILMSTVHPITVFIYAVLSRPMKCYSSNCLSISSTWWFFQTPCRFKPAAALSVKNWVRVEWVFLFYRQSWRGLVFPAVLERRKLLIPGSRTSMGRKSAAMVW